MSDVDRTLQDEIEAGERWLVNFETASPSQKSIGRVKQAVRAELAKARRGATAGRWATWQGVLAAAASIALAVTVGWHSSRQHAFSPVDVAKVDLVSTWPIETWEDAVASTGLDDDLSDLESWSAEEAWDLDGTALYEALEGALEDASEDGPAETGTSMWWPNAPNQVEEV
ncbi:MAG: hypothetical protein JXQ75_19990 [Phycisphaerae bacterium]|nr:hypothetical protein [Phycisphaerae bacterium]